MSMLRFGKELGQTYIEKTGRESLQCDHTLVSNLSTSMFGPSLN